MRSSSLTSHNVEIGTRRLDGILKIPHNAIGLIIFAHGSGSSRLSPRNMRVADTLNTIGLATLLFDLLTDEEAQDRRNVFDISLLGARVAEAISWARLDLKTKALPIGLFGASTGAAAALVAAAQKSREVAAVVTRGGRPDLASSFLQHVRAPTLLIVGGADHGVIELNEQALVLLVCKKKLEIVPGATHLFEERGALDRVIDMAGNWFTNYLRSFST